MGSEMRKQSCINGRNDKEVTRERWAGSGDTERACFPALSSLLHPLLVSYLCLLCLRFYQLSHSLKYWGLKHSTA